MTTTRNPMIRKGKAIISMTLAPDQVESLDRIVTQRRTSRAALLREAVDLFLAVNISRTAITSPHVNDEVAA